MRPVALFVFTSLWLSAVAFSQTAKDTLSYELIEAQVSSDAGREGQVVVEFGKSLPARYLSAANRKLSPAPEWLIEIRDLKNPSVVTTVDVKAINVPGAPAQERLVALEPSQKLDPSTHQIRVQLLLANFPEVRVSQPRKQGAAATYGPAKGKEDADLYFKGLVVASSGSAPAYSIDAKAGYFRALGTKGGSLGATGTYIVDKASDIGPDSITANASYSKVFVARPATGLILNADVLGFEFDAGNETRNLRSSAIAQFVFPSAHLMEKSYVTGDVVVGYEAGRNQSSKVSTESLGGLWRTVLGANGYALLQGTPGLRRIDVTASWKVRLLAQPEPFTERRNGADTTELTSKARHIVTVSAVLMLSKALGVSIGYRHGTEPPVYKNVRNRVEFGFVLKLKQIDKG